MTFWKVVSTTARPGSRWQREFAGDPDRAREFYGERLRDLRVGGLALLDAHGRAIERAWAPALRRRGA